MILSLYVILCVKHSLKSQQPSLYYHNGISDICVQTALRPSFNSISRAADADNSISREIRP